MPRLGLLVLLLLSPTLSGCFLSAVAPPPSQVPSAAAALARVTETQSCGHGLRARAKIDHFGPEGRVRAELMLYAIAPASLRMDAVSPFGATLATLTSDGQRFSLYDMREKRFLEGPAAACNIARLTQVPLPGHVLIGLLRGVPPVLAHTSPPTLRWDDAGFYVVTVMGANQAREEVRLAVHPDDFAKPWASQRLRLARVRVDQYDGTLYQASLEEPTAGQMAKAWEDPDGLPGESLPPSGPECTADLPRSIHLEIPPSSSDVLLRFDEVVWNPPVPPGTFTQPRPPGLTTDYVDCR